MRVCPTCNSLYGPDQAFCHLDGSETQHYTTVLIGMRLGPYVVRSQVSEGGMGVVFAGEHPTLGRRVALKVLRPEFSLRDALVERFVQEARAVSTIGHPNIVNIYDFGRTPFGSFYIVMEYLDGQTVRQLVDGVGPQSLERVRFIVGHVSRALSAAHQKGFIHRDVKPENIMVCEQGGEERVKLLDFGIVKLRSDEGRTETGLGSALGTPQYMSPEQLEDQAVDQRTDIYSLGAVTYQLLTGQVPYPGSSQAVVRQQQLTTTPPPPSVCRDDIALSRLVDAAVLTAVNVDVDARFPSVADFFAAFDEACRQSLSSSRTARSPLARPRSRWMVISAVVLLLAALGIIIGIFAARRDVSPVAKDVPQRALPTTPPAALEKLAASAVEAALAPAAPLAERVRAIELVGRLPRPQLEPALRQALEENNLRLKQQAVRSLGAFPRVTPATLAVLTGLLQGKRVQSAWLLLDVATALARLGDDRGTAWLRKRLERAESDLERIRILESLAQSGDPAGRNLFQHVAGSSRESRLRRLGYLAGLRDRRVARRARRQLRAALRSGPWEQRILAAEALAATDARPARQALKAVLANAPPDIRLRAALSLARAQGDASGVQILIESLPSAGEREAVEITLALGNLRSAEARPVLDRALREGEQDVRLAAAVALLDR